MSSAKNVVCPVEACKAPIGRQCKLVDMQNFQMVGGWHLVRVLDAAHATKGK